MEVLKQATLFPEEQKQFLESINYETKLFQKTNMGVSYCPENLSEAQAKVIRTRSLICNKFRATKERLHKETDPKFLVRLSKALDCRNWNKQEFNSEFEILKNRIISDVLAQDGGQDIFMKGLDRGRLEMELIECLDTIHKA